MSEGDSLTIGATSSTPLPIEPLQARSGCILSSWPASRLRNGAVDELTFLSLLPALAYTLDMYRRTGQTYGVTESLFSSALAAIVFSIFSAQPLTIVGITGLISLFNFTAYDIIERYDITLYSRFMCWTAIWAAISHWCIALWNLCDYMRYVTDFSSEAFGMYVGIIYLGKCLRIPSGANTQFHRSQRCGGAGVRIFSQRKIQWVRELPDCDSIFWIHLWAGKARRHCSVAALVQGFPGRLCLRGESFSASKTAL